MALKPHVVGLAGDVAGEPAPPDAPSPPASAARAGRTTSRRPKRAKRGRKRRGDGGAIGDLEAFGVEQLWQLATLLPRRYEDLRHVSVNFDDLKDGQWVCQCGRGVACAPVAPAAEDDAGDAPGRGEAESSGPCRRHVVMIEDLTGRSRVSFTIDDETAARRSLIGAAASGSAVWVHGRVSIDDAGCRIVEAESVLESEIGEVLPVYPGRSRQRRVVVGKRVRNLTTRITPAQVRQQLEPHLRASIAQCRRVVTKRLHLTDKLSEIRLMAAVDSPGATVELTLRLAHRPYDVACGEAACLALERLVALEALLKVAEERMAQPDKTSVLAVRADTFADAVASVEARLSVKLTGEQLDACVEILGDLAGRKRTHRFLSGDVGTGKTLVFGVVAATIAAGGGLVVVLEPRTSLVSQIAARLQDMFPSVCVIAAETGSRSTTVPASGIVVGTTGVWRHLAESGVTPYLVIADEQHKYGIAQRLPVEYSDVTNVLECTATAIPRTKALLEYGGMEVTNLRTSHLQKHVVTEVVEDPVSLDILVDTVREEVSQGSRNLLIVLPTVRGTRVSDGGDGDGDGDDYAVFDDDARVDDWTPESIAQVVDGWRDALPGMVDVIHGKMDEDDQLAALSRFECGTTRVLIGTTILEVGLDLPQADMMMIFCPERLGVAAVHQLRGRLARRGGRGECYLVVGARATHSQRAMIHVVAEVNDGYELAMMDMHRRGTGDIRQFSNQQSGRYRGFLVGRVPAPETFAFVASQCAAWVTGRSDDVDLLAEHEAAGARLRTALRRPPPPPALDVCEAQISLF